MRAIQLYTVLLSTLFVSINAANAAIVKHEDFSSFDSATSSLQTEGFDGIASDTLFNSSPLALGDFSLSVTNPADLGGIGADRNLIDVTPFIDSPGTGSPDFSSPIAYVRIDSGTMTSLIFTFNTAINAFGAYFEDLSVGSAEILLGSETAPSYTSATGFLGFTSSDPFTVVTFQTDSNNTFYFDNVQYQFASTESAVPEPSSLALLGASGLLLIGVARRRKKETAV